MKEYKTVYLNEGIKFSRKKDLKQAEEIINQYVSEGWTLQQVVSMSDGMGTSISSIGFKIVVTSYTSDLIDEAIGNNCPFCKDPITEGELFCSKCGNPVRKKCPSCDHINDLKCGFCIKFGSKL